MAFVSPSLSSTFLSCRQRTLSCSSSHSRRYAARKAYVRMQQSNEEEQTISLGDFNKIRSSADAETQLETETSAPASSTKSSLEKPGERDLMSTADPNEARLAEIERLRAAEKFIEIDEGKYECTSCAYVYEPEKGDSQNSIPPGTDFQDIPDYYTCPVCRTPKNRFIAQKKVIAGFADNQGYGFGSNTMTGGQKNLLIFGGLALCALLLLSGYALN